MSKKLTPWFPGDVNPFRVGVYEIYGSSFTGRVFRVWNGNGWGSTLSSPSGVDSLQCVQCVTYYWPGEDMTGWRGLTKDAK